MRNLFITILLAAISIYPLRAQEGLWLRYPNISPDGKTIVFTYKGDLWEVATTGGTAIPLTMHEAHDFMPIWSKDSKTIAFASDRFGNFDIYTIAAEGGQAKRLTFHSANEYPYDFSTDNQTIIFGSTRQDVAANRQFPTGSQPELYSISVKGGTVKQIFSFSTPAEDIKTQSRDGGSKKWCITTKKKETLGANTTPPSRVTFRLPLIPKPKNILNSLTLQAKIETLFCRKQQGALFT
ncbi:MAG: hypothetical protein R2822_29500 [Spirosomataceae bacterium]